MLEGLEHKMIYWSASILLGCTNPSDIQRRPHLMLMRALALLLIVPQDSEDQRRREDIPQRGSMATLFHCMQISISGEAYNQSSVHSSEKDHCRTLYSWFIHILSQTALYAYLSRHKLQVLLVMHENLFWMQIRQFYMVKWSSPSSVLETWLYMSQ